MMRIFTLFTTTIILLLGMQYSVAQQTGSGDLQSSSTRNFTTYTAVISGAQEVTDPAGGVLTRRLGRVAAFFNSTYSRMQVIVRLNSAADVVGMHFHCGRAGENGPLALGLISPGPLVIQGNSVAGVLTNSDVMGDDCLAIIGQPVNNLVSLAAAMEAGLIYINVHTTQYPAGEIRGQMSLRK